MEPCRRLYEIFKALFLLPSAEAGLIDLMNLSLAEDGTPVYTAVQERKKRTCSCLENDLPVFPFLNSASMHDPHGFLYNWYSIKQFLSEAAMAKLILDSAHDAMPYYEYRRNHGIVPFIDLNGKGGRPPVYKDYFTINEEGVPVCREGHPMRRNGIEPAKGG